MVMPAHGGGDPASALLQALGASGGGPPAPPGSSDQGGGQQDPLAALQSVINDLHTLMTVLPDGNGTSVAAQCLAALTKLQSGMMQTGQQAASQFGG